MIENSSKTSKLAALILVIVNLIAVVISLLVIAFGLWVISSPSTLHVAKESLGVATVSVLLPAEQLTVQLGIGSVAVASFFLFVSLMGLYGAFNRSPFLLFMYATLVLLLLLLECALMHYFSSGLIEKGIQEQDGQWAHALRLAFGCCEQNSSTRAGKLSWSCCGTSGYPDNCTSNHAYTKSCQGATSTWLDSYQTAIYATLVATHVVLASCSLVRRQS